MVLKLWKVGQKYLESFKMWCWRSMEKISWTDHVINESFLKGKEKRNILQTIKIRNVDWIGHMLCRNCFLKQVTEGKLEGKIEVTRRRRIRRTKLLDDLNEKRGSWKLKEESLDRMLWRGNFGRGYGPK
jgi:hypothetical protein